MCVIILVSYIWNKIQIILDWKSICYKMISSCLSLLVSVSVMWSIQSTEPGVTDYLLHILP